MNNLLSYCGLVDATKGASEKDLLVRYPSRKYLHFIKEFGFNFESREEGGMLTSFYLCSDILLLRSCCGFKISGNNILQDFCGYCRL